MLKNKGFKKLVCFIIVSAMIMVFLMGCNKSGDEKNEDTKTEGKMTDDKDSNKKEKMKISFVSLNCGNIDQDAWAILKLEEELNIDLDVKKVNIQDGDQINLMLSSGEMPDCGWISRNAYDMYYVQELTRSVPVSMVREYSPRLAAFYDKYPIIWKIFKTKESDEELMSLSGFDPSFLLQSIRCMYYRLDWLENLGIDLPEGEIIQLDDDGRIFASKYGYPLDDFEDIMRRFTEDDPDGNNENDTYGYSANKEVSHSWINLMGAFGLSWYWNHNVDGKVRPAYVLEDYKDFLKFANRIYEKGYIDPEAFVLDMHIAWDKITNGMFGCFQNGVSSLSSWAQNRPPLSLLSVDGDSKVLMTPGPIGPEGKWGSDMYRITPQKNYFHIRKDVDDEKLKRILEFVDFCGFDEEAQLYLRYGEEGVHFDWEGEPYKSAAVLKEDTELGGKTGLVVFNDYMNTGVTNKYQMTAAWQKASEFSWGIWAEPEHLFKPYKADLFYETKFEEERKKYNNAIKAIRDEFMAQAIVGEIDIDAEWDSYIKKLEKAKLFEMLSLLDDIDTYENMMSE